MIYFKVLASLKYVFHFGDDDQNEQKYSIFKCRN